MSDKIRWGILGTGGIAHAQANDLLRHGFAVSAVGSRDQLTAEAFAREFGIHTAHGSYEALVNDPDVDVVYVATPHTFHYANTLLALNAGKHVLVEKPFALNAVEAREIIEAARERHLVVQEAMWTRFLPHMARIREIIAEGTVGEVRTLMADHAQLLPSDPTHRLNNPLLGGGALLDLGVYLVSFAYDVFGAPERVEASAAMTPTGVDRQTAVVLTYVGGQQALLHTALDSRGTNRASIIGTVARIEVSRVWFAQTTFTVYNSRDEIIEHYEEPAKPNGMQYQCWEVERRIREDDRSTALLPPQQSLQIMETLDEIRRQIGLHYPSENPVTVAEL